ncbi:MAG: 5'-nucleotidase C-terminal domain-containing protein [Bacteroidetes bacterium]|nr:5'-nucleotidase C-terminal domain-containing protein [Bacteroidota bacterium]
MKLQNIQGVEVALTDSLEKDIKIDSLITPYRVGMQQGLERVLAYNLELLNKSEGQLETRLGNWFADALMAQANFVLKQRLGKSADAGLFNHGGIRNILAKGDVKVADIYGVMPFENALVALELTSDQMLALATYLVQSKTAHPIWGLQLTMDHSGVLKNFLIQQKPIQENKTYWVVTNDYLMNGGDQMNFFKNPVLVLYLDYKVRNALIDYLDKTDTIYTKIDGRFRVQ